MPASRASQRLIVNADDFGRSASINEAVIRAHREGILTTASLMVNEEDCAGAVALAKKNSRLGVGLHLSLLCGRPALQPERIPGLVNAQGFFRESPVAVGWRYFFQPSLRGQLREEMAAQFDRFRATGLPLDHVNGHLHLHLHPVVFSILMENAERWAIRRIRLTRDPLWLNLQVARGHWLYRLSHAIIFSALSQRSLAPLQRRGIRFTTAVFGLLQNARVNEDYVCRVLASLPPGDSELYSHPSLDEFRHEFDALVSPRVRAIVVARGIELIRYQDL